ncbi:MAG TPA: phosphatidate cytidylyltransferase, partial [Bacillota bacterium]|nr:phosphatidate cytidylyltransferase [Bacillota bacterium]
GSVLFCGLFGWFVVPWLLVHCIVIGVLGGVISQFGDLTASIFKRKMGIKDYGNLIPGHGGIMDRFDSVLFTAPMVYYYIMLVIN